MCGEVCWNFHVRIIGEGHTGESITCERLIAHFVKAGSGWCLINVAGQVELIQNHMSGNATYQDLWNVVSISMCEERRHNWVGHARRNKNGVIGGDN